jgi:hypothetical protein
MRTQERTLHELQMPKVRTPQKRVDLNIQEIEKNYRIDANGSIFSLHGNKYLKPARNTAGHLYVGLFKYKLNCMISVARIVAEKYIGKPPLKAKLIHKDYNLSNNNHTNLEYSTHSQIILNSHSNKRVFYSQ